MPRNKYYWNNPEKARKYVLAWAKANPEKVKATKKRYRDNHPERYLVKAARSNAKKSGREFDLLETDIQVPEVCPVLKVPLIFGTPYAPSIDRIDSTRGYTKDNVQVISKKANTMKNNATKEELISFAKWILSLE